MNEDKLTKRLNPTFGDYERFTRPGAPNLVKGFQHSTANVERKTDDGSLGFVFL